MTDFSELTGKTIARIDGAETGSESIVFGTTEGRTYTMYHSQDCCESVSLAEVIGDVADLIGSPVLLAEEASYSDEDPPELGPQDDSYRESWTWTFYKLSTIKGSVTLRWLGESNGYYSESVYFESNTQ